MPFPPPYHRHLPGLTLVELAAAVALLAILVAVALPALVQPLERSRADTTRMRLVSVFNTARAMAITHRRAVTVCPSIDGTGCDADWARGWLIQVDRSPNAAEEASPRQFMGGTRSPRIRVDSTEGRKYLRFQGDGRSGGNTLTVSICVGAELHSAVIVNNVGRTRSARQRNRAPCPF
ncbi:GspH/FimT family protein [Stenotrophomonas indicatrix]|uniref:GspH/FimT family protein n=1 Tax=Stenotrophomonas indicatrix TaxID=2045451 RepID=UPI0013DBAB57|nr:GspH/FimT family protein [Stenotrophomonas indicatrix]